MAQYGSSFVYSLSQTTHLLCWQVYAGISRRNLPCLRQFPPLPSTHMDTNKHKHTALRKHMHAPTHTVILILPSFSLSHVGIVLTVSTLIAVLQLGPVHPDYSCHLSQPLTRGQEGWIDCHQRTWCRDSYPLQCPLSSLLLSLSWQVLSSFCHSSMAKAQSNSERCPWTALSAHLKERPQNGTKTVHLDR